MTRAEWFLARDRGKWVKARKTFLCDFRGRFGPCLNPVEPGEMYFRTSLAKAQALRGQRQPFAALRYCQHCANQELPKV